MVVLKLLTICFYMNDFINPVRAFMIQNKNIQNSMYLMMYYI